jgi:hypothetical protein
MKEILCMEEYLPRKHLSCTAMCNFKRCPRKFFYQNGLRLSWSPEPHLAMKFGEGIHFGLPHCFPGQGGCLEALAAFRKIWEGRDSLGDKKRNLSVALKIFKAFEEKTKVYAPVLVEQDKMPELVERKSPWEVPFAVDIGLDVPLVGYIDMLGETLNGELWGVEFKTTSELGSRFMENFQRSPQIGTYTLALNVQLGKPVKGVFLEALLVAGTKTECLMQPIEPQENFLEDVIQWYVDGYEGIKRCEEARVFEKNLSACTSYAEFGRVGYPCEYSSLCDAGCWEALRSSFFQGEEHLFVIEKKAGEKGV